MQCDVAKAKVYDGLAMGRKNKHFLASLSVSGPDMGCLEKDIWLLNRLYIFMLVEIPNVAIMASCGRIHLLCTLGCIYSVIVSVSSLVAPFFLS